ncbi:MAG: ABC-type transport system involved in multi-copper enzyme maturation permease subunit [Natrialbaceae archaeon]|jgi:ABC-type transport system involved in multi-copper enzyme maturation permease subunit
MSGVNGTTRFGRLLAVVDREVATVIRTRSYVVLALVYGAILLALSWTGGESGYVPLTVDLLTPVELLVPPLATAFGYRAVLADSAGKEIEALGTYPLSRLSYVLGVYLGRLAILLIVVLIPLFVAGLLVPGTGGQGSGVVASHETAGSIFLYLRFIVLTAVFAAAVLAAAVAVSTVARTARAALAFAVVLVIVLLIGADLGIVAGLAGGIVGEEGLAVVIASSPNSAFRGLVLGTIVSVVGSETVRAGSAFANLVGLIGWLIGSLLIAIITVWPNVSEEAWQVVDPDSDEPSE